jgi:low affinity Fe/Cu permease
MTTAARARETTSFPSPALAIKRDLFTRCATWATRATGGRWGFLIALATVIVWAVSGPYFEFSQTWQLVINTGTTIVTFLMVFLIQNAQNRESKAIHLKLDELILRVHTARNEMIDIEHLTEEQLDYLASRYSRIARMHQHKLEECFERAMEAEQPCRENAAAPREEIVAGS